MQKNRVVQAVMHAYQTVPYYRTLYNKLNLNMSLFQDECNLQVLPILTKDQVISQGINMISSDYNIQKLIIEYTSGSTGIPLTIYKSVKDKVAQGMSLWKHRHKRFNVYSGSSYCSWQAKSKIIHRYNNGLFFPLVSLDDTNLRDDAEALLLHRPEWLFGGAEAWLILGRYMLSNNIAPPDTIKFIETSGEFLSDSKREELEFIYRCEVVDMYGCTELYGIAITCENNRMHILEDNVVVEILDENGSVLPNNTEGEVVLTSLNNSAMPLIRYSIGDRGKILEDRCNCANDSPIIELTAARNNDNIIFNDGRSPLNAAIFSQIFTNINLKINNSISSFKVIQDDIDSMTVLVVFRNDNICVHELGKALIINEMKRNGVDNFKIKINVMESINIDQVTGKYKYFECRVENNSSRL